MIPLPGRQQSLLNYNDDMRLNIRHTTMHQAVQEVTQGDEVSCLPRPLFQHPRTLVIHNHVTWVFEAKAQSSSVEKTSEFCLCMNASSHLRNYFRPAIASKNATAKCRFARVREPPRPCGGSYWTTLAISI